MTHRKLRRGTTRIHFSAHGELPRNPYFDFTLVYTVFRRQLHNHSTALGTGSVSVRTQITPLASPFSRSREAELRCATRAVQGTYTDDISYARGLPSACTQVLAERREVSCPFWSGEALHVRYGRSNRTILKGITVN